MRSIDKSPNSSIERPTRRGKSLSELRASPRDSAPGLFRIRSKNCIPAAFGIENRCSTRDSTTSEQPQNTMKLFYTVTFFSLFSLLASAAFAREESILARVTSYLAGEGNKYASTGRRLHSGHCAVVPK